MSEKRIFCSRGLAVSPTGETLGVTLWTKDEERASAEAGGAPGRTFQAFTLDQVQAIESPAQRLKALTGWVNAYPEDAALLVD